MLTQAQNFTSATDGDWNDTNTWNEAGFPGAGDNVVIQTGHTVTIANAGGRACANLTIEGTGRLDFTVSKNLQISNNLNMSGTSSITGTANNQRVTVTNNFNLTSGTASIGGVRFTINGTTTLDGTLSFTSATGNKVFNIIDVNAGGTWDNSTLDRDFSISGNVINDGSWNGCLTNTGCRYDITGTTQFSGSGTTTVADLRINTPATATNIGNLTLTDDLTGTGSFTNDNGGTLTLTENGTYSVTTLDLDNTGNTVVYAGGTNDNLLAGPFYDLQINMDAVGVRAQVSGNNVTVNNNLTLTQGLLRLQSANTLTVGGNLNINGGEFSPNNTGAILNVTGDIVMTSGEYDHNNGDVNITDDFLISGGSFNLNGTSTIDADQITVQAVTLELVAGTVSATNAIADGITLNNAGIITLNGATLNVTNNLNIDDGTAEFSPNNIASVATIGGNLTLTNGIYDHNNGQVNVTGNFTVSNGDLSMANANSVLDVDGTYQVSGGVNDFNAGTFTPANMIVDAGQTVTFGGLTVTAGGTATLNGTLTIDGGGGDKNFTNMTLAGTGNLNFTSNETVALSGNLNMSGTSSLTGTSNSQIVNVTGTFDVPSGTASIGGVQLNVTGTTTVTGNVSVTSSTGTKTLGNLTMVSAGNLNFTIGETISVGGDLNMSGTSSITGTDNSHIVEVTGTFTVSSGTASLSGIRFTANGNTVLDGSLSFTSTTGIKNFTNITVNGSGTWNNGTVAEDFNISGDITNNGTWTGCSGTGCNYTLTSTSGSINGTAVMNSVSDLVIDGSASYTNNNTGGLNVTDRITGTGTFINGANALLNYSGNNTGANINFDIGTFTASATGNTVTYSRSGDQDLEPTTGSQYYNLIINTSAAGDDVNLTENVTINNQLTLTSGDLVLGTFRLTIPATTTISGGSSGSYIRADGGGVLRQEYAGVGATLTFPLGDNEYSPITALTINSATLGASPYLEFSVTDANHPNRNTSNTPTGDDDGTAAVAFISRYWTVAANDITDPDYDVSYQYLDADITGTESDMVGTLYRIQPTLLILDWFVTGIVDPSSNTVTLTGADAFGDLYAMDNTSNRLPITLLSFEGRAYGDYVELQWVTAAEENNDFFTLERSANAKDYEPILYRSGAGNSNGELTYVMRDESPLNGRAFYRLKQTDFNGTFTYSELISVVNEPINKIPDIRIFKNPVSAGEIVTIERARAVPMTMTLVSMNGMVKLEESLGPDSGKSIDLRIPYDTAPGFYVLGFYEASQRQTFKLWVR